jgi:L-galactose dehydrogenase
LHAKSSSFLPLEVLVVFNFSKSGVLCYFKNLTTNYVSAPLLFSADSAPRPIAKKITNFPETFTVRRETNEKSILSSLHLTFHPLHPFTRNRNRNQQPGFHDPKDISKMPYRPLMTGDSNPPLLVSVIGIGCSSFFSAGEVVLPPPEKLDPWIKSVRKALKLGINVIDTAPWYGHGLSHLVLGEALKGVPRSAFYLHTKVGRYEAEASKMFDFSAAKTKASVLDSLEVMGVDYIDLMQVHDPEFDCQGPNLEEHLSTVLNETIPELVKLRAEGKVRRIGITGYPLEVHDTILRECEKRDIKIENMLSYAHSTLFDSTLLTEKHGGETIVDQCKRKKIGVMSAAP